ncbi:MAG: D-tyrosyl-tRNA(Tyr) deacylase [Armatimonadetes bacterium]|nr:D-tyrosyl-tRNA(Tyr) deacylase [Armatimonadota bacterium]
MRGVFQRVTESRVEVAGRVVGQIGVGANVLVGVGQEDTEADARALADKVAGLRVFEDDQGKMNRSLREVGGSVLAVSQFTLFGDTRKGRRPSFTGAAEPERAERLYALFCETLREMGVDVQEGIFRASMKVYITNDGPVTLLLDTRIR